MTGPNVSEHEVERQARIRADLAKLNAAVQAGRLPREAIQRYVERERITPEMEADRTPQSGAERVLGGVQAVTQGTTFNFGDEIAGFGGAVVDKIRDGGDFGQLYDRNVGEQRANLQQFREENPKSALGLELGGGLLAGLGAAGVARGAASGVSAAGRVAASGAGGGALAGAGSGDGGMDRTLRAGAGAAIGGVVGAALPRVAGAFRESVAGGGQVTDDLLTRIAQKAPAASAGRAATTVANAAAPAPPAAAPAPQGLSSPNGYGEPALRATQRAMGDPAKARSLLAELEQAGMGSDALTMNVAPNTDRAARAARAAANMPSSDAGQMVNDRLAAQGGRLGEAVAGNPRLGVRGDIATATGMSPKFPEVQVADMQADLTAKVKAGYDAFRALPEVPLDPNDEAQRMFIERYVQPVIENRRLSGQLSGASALSGETVDAAFKNLQREIRGGQAAVGMGNRGVASVETLEAMRNRVLGAIEQVDPNYAQLGRTYALDEDVGKVVQGAFDEGLAINTPGAAEVALRGTTPAGQQAMRAGNVANLQSAARRGGSNADLGELARFRDVARAVVGTPESRETFIAFHGKEKYDALLGMLMPKIRAAVQNAAARGNSTTTKQLLDALAFGDDAAMDALGSLTGGGSPQGKLMGLASRFAVEPINRAVRLGVGQTATETADLLTRQGSGEIRSVLDLIESLNASDAAKRKAVAPVAGAVGRLPFAGRDP